jgi:hypothetical protein
VTPRLYRARDAARDRATSPNGPARDSGRLSRSRQRPRTIGICRNLWFLPVMWDQIEEHLILRVDPRPVRERDPRGRFLPQYPPLRDRSYYYEICEELGIDLETDDSRDRPDLKIEVWTTRFGKEVREFARHGTTMALFLSAARSGQLQQELLDGGYPPETPCLIAYQATWPEELLAWCELSELEATVKEHKLWKHTLVLVGPALSAGGTRSHLYHPGHFHGYRRADRQARRELRTLLGLPPDRITPSQEVTR